MRGNKKWMKSVLAQAKISSKSDMPWVAAKRTKAQKSKIFAMAK